MRGSFNPRRAVGKGTALLALIAAGGASAAPIAPPWKRNPPISARSGDARIVVREWRIAENRATCAPLAFNTTRFIAPGARPRRAVFSGGWGVAYDRGARRSLFGLAGAGIDVESGDITRWRKQRRWSDGSAMGWGLVGDTGPGFIAYVKVAGRRCLYNVWSDVSERHLLLLVAHLRRVR